MITDTWRPNFLLPETILTLGKRQYNITPTSTTHISGKSMSGKDMGGKLWVEKAGWKGMGGVASGKNTI